MFLQHSGFGIVSQLHTLQWLLLENRNTQRFNGIFVLLLQTVDDILVILQ